MSEGKVRVIIKRPDEKFGHVTNISVRLENLQKTVEGHIETLPCGNHSVILCNESGKLIGLEKNFKYGIGYPHDIICGTVIVIGMDPEAEDFCDLAFSFQTWKELLKVWGN